MTENNLKLKAEDMKIIENMAEKYGMSVQDLGRSLLVGKFPRVQINFTIDELQTVDSRAGRLNLTRSTYCCMCFEKAMEKNMYKSINVIDIIKRYKKGTKKKKVAISLPINEYDRMLKVAKDVGVPFSSLIKYFALNVKL